MRVEFDSAQVRIPPPLLFSVCLIAGWGLDQGRSWPIFAAARWHGLRVALSAGLIVFGFGLIGYCAWLFKRAQTCIEPWRATSSIIANGPYRYSRNPIYLAFSISGAGIALAFDTGWMLLGVLAFALIADRYVIEKEEKYLAAKFGEAYSNYRRATRRWL